MAFLSWTDEYSVHVKSMDDQHRRLVDLINQLHDAMLVGKGKQVIGQVLESLVRYTQTHFLAEERLMSTHGYPALAQHKLEHEALVRKVAEIQGQVHNGRITVSLGVLEFLKKWLIDHIAGSDQGYGEFLNAQGLN